MSDQSASGQSLEQALRQTLRPREPDAAFADRVLARLEAEPAGPGAEADAASRLSSRGPAPRRSAAGGALWRWLGPVLAACLIAGLGITHWRQLQRERAIQARTQLLQALVIASRNVDIARSVVLDAQQERTP